MKANGKYKDWLLFDELPDGWAIDKTCGSPIANYVFINNKTSIVRGGKRALLKVRKPSQQINTDLPATLEIKPREEPKKKVFDTCQAQYKLLPSFLVILART